MSGTFYSGPWVQNTFWNYCGVSILVFSTSVFVAFSELAVVALNLLVLLLYSILKLLQWFLICCRFSGFAGSAVLLPNFLIFAFVLCFSILLKLWIDGIEPRPLELWGSSVPQAYFWIYCWDFGFAVIRCHTFVSEFADVKCKYEYCWVLFLLISHHICGTCCFWVCCFLIRCSFTQFAVNFPSLLFLKARSFLPNYCLFFLICCLLNDSFGQFSVFFFFFSSLSLLLLFWICRVSQFAFALVIFPNVLCFLICCFTQFAVVFPNLLWCCWICCRFSSLLSFLNLLLPSWLLFYPICCHVSEFCFPNCCCFLAFMFLDLVLIPNFLSCFLICCFLIHCCFTQLASVFINFVMICNLLLCFWTCCHFPPNMQLCFLVHGFTKFAVRFLSFFLFLNLLLCFRICCCFPVCCHASQFAVS